MCNGNSIKDCISATHLFVKLGDPLLQVGVLMQTEVIDGLLYLLQDLTEGGMVVLAGVQGLHLQIDVLLDGQQVVHLLLVREHRLSQTLHVRVQLVRLPHQVDALQEGTRELLHICI